MLSLCHERNAGITEACRDDWPSAKDNDVMGRKFSTLKGLLLLIISQGERSQSGGISMVKMNEFRWLWEKHARSHGSILPMRACDVFHRYV